MSCFAAVPLLKTLRSTPYRAKSPRMMKRVALEANDAAQTEAQAKAFETGVLSARVVRLPHANHFVFLSNEADVLREMRAFFDTLH